MDNEQAKLILQAYRPGGEDAGDPFFAEALEQARRDPELGRCLAEQRAFDDAMRAALLADSPPPGLRDAIRLARRVAVFPQKARRPVWQRPGLLALAAAFVAILAVIALLTPRAAREATGSMTVASFTKQVLDLKESGGITLGKMSSDPTEIRAWLAERGAPSNFELPPGLRNVPGLGCQSYTLGGTKVSLVCFMLGKDEVVHVFVVDEAALEDAAPDSWPILHAENGQAWATWTSGGKSYVLTGMNVTEETLRRLI
jgi:hypothetical protein